MSDIVNPDAVKAARFASCRKRQMKDLWRHCGTKGYKGPEVQVLTVLWAHLPNDKTSAVCWPTVATIAGYACISERSVTRALADLIAAGEVWVARPSRRRRRGPAGNLLIGTMNVDRGVSLYLLTRYAPKSELREWADLARSGENIAGAGIGAHATPTPARGDKSPANEG